MKYIKLIKTKIAEDCFTFIWSITAPFRHGIKKTNILLSIIEMVLAIIYLLLTPIRVLLMLIIVILSENGRSHLDDAALTGNYCDLASGWNDIDDMIRFIHLGY